MGTLLSKKVSCNLEASPPVFGRYTIIDDEFTIRPSNFTSQYKRMSASPAGSLDSRRSSGRVAKSPLRKRLKFDHISMEAFEKPKMFIPNRPSLKRPPIARTNNTKDIIMNLDNEKSDKEVLTILTPKTYRRLTLRTCIRRRPSYRKALKTPTKLPQAPESYVIPEEPLESKHESEIGNAILRQTEIYEMDTIIEPLPEYEYAEWETDDMLEKCTPEERLEQKIIFENLITQHQQLIQENKPININSSSENELDLATFKRKSSLKICHRYSQRHAPYETIKPKSTEELNRMKPSLLKVEMLTEHNLKIPREHHLREMPEESPLIMGKLLRELKQRLAEIDERKRRNSLPILGRDGTEQDKHDSLKIRSISEISSQQAQLFGKLMIELKQHLAKRNAWNGLQTKSDLQQYPADNLKSFETTRMKRGIELVL